MVGSKPSDSTGDNLNTTSSCATTTTATISNNTVPLPSSGETSSTDTLVSTISALQDSIVGSVALRLPEFFQSCPSVWFIQAETQFRLKNITAERTKFDYIVASLPLEVAMTVMDIIEKPPPTNQYTELKQQLIYRFSLSEEQKLDKLLSECEIGDRKPSEFYRSLSLLAGKSGIINQDLLLKLWLRRLPTTVKQILTATQSTSAEDLTRLADQIMEVSENKHAFSVNSHRLPSSSVSFLPPTAIAGTLTTPSAPQSSSANITAIESSRLIGSISQLCTTLSEMTMQFQDLKKELSEVKAERSSRQTYRSPHRFRSRSRSRGFSNSRRRSLSNSPYCYYHFTFGDAARKCEKPCTYKPKDDDSKN